jgi:NADP-dependent 3-hydroxy acid dehydrogenase YdfG
VSRIDLTGRGVVLSGATGGIGREIARVLLEHGARVALVSRPTERLEELEAQLDHPDAVAFPADVTDRAQVVEAVDAAAERFGGLCGVIAGAGAVVTGTIAEQSEEDCRRVVDTNLYGTLWTMQAALPHVDRAGGHLLAVASIAGIVPIPLSGVYPATKAAVGELAAQLRIELMHRPTSAGVFYLGMVESEMAEAVAEDERIERTLERSPRLLRSALPVDEAAGRIVHALAHRQASAVAPWWQLPVAAPQLGLQLAVETGMRAFAIARELPRRAVGRGPGTADR